MLPLSEFFLLIQFLPLNGCQCMVSVLALNKEICNHCTVVADKLACVNQLCLFIFIVYYTSL